MIGATRWYHATTTTRGVSGMDAGTVERRRFGMSARFAAVVALVALAVLAAPGTASAQFPSESWAADRCDNRSGANSDGPYTVPDQFNHIYVNLAGSGGGTVNGAMYGTQSQECLNPMGATCPPTCSPQGWAVSTVCELHCWHNHSAPYPWWVSLDPNPQPGSSFVGWSATCVPTKGLPRDVCVVFMQTDHTVTATFSTTPDASPPTAPSASAAPFGRYSVDLSWTPSSDQWLAGYDLYQGSAHISRASRTATSHRVENLLCETNYTFRVDAYDWSGNATPSNVASVRTGPCITPEPTGAPPNTVIHVKPPRSTRARTAFFHFGLRGSIPATRYQCKLDRGRWRACSASRGIRYRRLRPGIHTFRVRAGNANGFDRTPATHRWRVRR